MNVQTKLAIVRALRASRRQVQQDLDLTLESACKLDANGAPRRRTLERGVRPFVKELEQLLAKIDRAIEMVRK